MTIQSNKMSLYSHLARVHDDGECLYDILFTATDNSVAVVALVYDGASTIRVDRFGVTEEGKQYCRLDKEF